MFKKIIVKYHHCIARFLVIKHKLNLVIILFYCLLFCSYFGTEYAYGADHHSWETILVPKTVSLLTVDFKIIQFYNNAYVVSFSVLLIRAGLNHIEQVCHNRVLSYDF